MDSSNSLISEKLSIKAQHSIYDRTLDKLDVEIIGFAINNTTSLKQEVYIRNSNINNLTIDNIIENDDRVLRVHIQDSVIGDLTIKSIKYKIEIHTYNSVIGGRLEGSTVSSAHFNNTVIRYLYFNSIENIFIHYHENNFIIREWLKIVDMLGLEDPRGLFEEKQKIIISNPKICRITYNSENNSSPKGLYADHYPFSNRKTKVRAKYIPHESELLKNNVSLQVTNYQNQCDEFIIRGLTIKGFSIKGDCYEKIKISNSRFNRVYIDNLNLSHPAKFQYIDAYGVNSQLEIKDSDLVDSELYVFKMHSFQNVSIFLSKINKVNFNACTFPNDIGNNIMTVNNVHYLNDIGINHNLEQYHTFLQLQEALKGKGNFQELQEVKYAISECIRKSNYTKNSDKFILCLNKVSNKHGTSVLRPFLVFLAFSIAAYLIYLASIQRLFLRTEFDWGLAKKYFEFINITHQTNFIYDINTSHQLSFFSVLWDWFSKVALAFIIFQFISAFRKYAKS